MVQLPDPPAGWFNDAFAVIDDDNLALIRTSLDLHATHREWRNAMLRGENPETRQLPAIKNRFSVFDGHEEAQVMEAQLGGCRAVSRWPDGRWLVAASRAWHEDLNGHILNADGSPVFQLHLSDGISHVLCGDDGTIWIGYFDEGVFGAALPDGQWPLSSSGIANITNTGEVKFRANDHETTVVDDCYALTLAANTVWACTYSSFPIIRIENKTIRRWTNSVSGAKALAVQGNRVILFGGFADDQMRIALVRLDHTEAILVGECDLSGYGADGPILVQGRGDTIHVVDDRTWRRIRVSDVEAYLQKRDR